MRPIVTLLTDYGQLDSYVAEVKAAVLNATPDARLIDITHEVSPGDVCSAQYLLGRTWHRFPPGTVHLAIVDPGVGSARRAIAVGSGGHFFVGPDNGLFTTVMDGADLVELPVPKDSAPTFHGRDVFAPAAGRLAAGEPLEKLGPPLKGPVRSPLPVPRRQGGAVQGEVIYVDRFGTLITNIPGDWVARAAKIEVVGKPAGPLRRTFAEVESGATVVFVGSGGMLEIAVRDGSAAEKLGAKLGTVVRALIGS